MRWAATVASCAAWLALQGAPSQAAECATHTIGLDTTMTTSFLEFSLNEAIGQTFYASDTLIRSVTIWRLPDEVGWGFGVRFYIIDTDSIGGPGSQILYSSPVIYNYGGDGVHPIELRFDFDPPVSLPSRGLFEMALMSYPCGGDWGILARRQASDAYPPGKVWHHPRSPNPPCLPRLTANPVNDADVVFQMEFCETPTWASPS